MAQAGRLRIIPLGGLGEVGMNCMAFEQNDELLLVDCGVCFPDGDYGVDVVVPAFDWLADNWPRVKGVFLTHGHEDHIGALPYLFAHGALPLWGPPHALGLVRRRFADHGIDWNSLQVTRVQPGQRYAVGSFEVEPVRVSHSIVEATALRLRTDAGVVVHSGDFKFDPTPSDGEPTNEQRLAEIGAEGVELLLSDSTNVDSLGNAGSEADVELALESIVKRAERRVFVALFSSNVQRLISLGRIARRQGRRLCLLGRSLLQQVELARELGYLDWDRDWLLPADALRSYPKSGVLVLATGTQGEPAAAMARLATGNNRFVEVEAGDTVVFSSRIIPGCERPVMQLMSQLLRLGARLETRWSTSGVHTSGHANRDEQHKLIQLLQPRAFVPIHGTLHHLTRHAELAHHAGVEQVQVIENGQSLVLEQGKIRLGERVHAGLTHVAHGGERLSEGVLTRRRDLGRQGLVSVSVVCDGRGKLVEPPSLQVFGLPGFGERADAGGTKGEALRRHLCEEWPRLSARSARDAERGSERNGAERPWMNGVGFVSLQSETLPLAIEQVVQRWLDMELRQRPLVSVHVHELGEVGAGRRGKGADQ